MRAYVADVAIRLYHYYVYLGRYLVTQHAGETLLLFT
jgi:hypothetical protein